MSVTSLTDARADAAKPSAVSPDGSFDAYKARTRFANLDGLRFFAILMVLWHHAPRPDLGLTLFERGFLGVDLFFVLSGYLITTLLLRERERTGRFSLRGFYLRRILRIVPLYYFVVTVVSLYYVVVKGQWELAELVPYYYAFLSNFLVGEIPTLWPTWSLSMEEQFYILWPLLLLLLPLRFLVPLGLVLIVLNLLAVTGFFGVAAPRFGPLVIALPPATYAPLIIGGLLAILLNSRRGFDALSRVIGGRWAFLGLTALLVLLIEVLPADLRGLPNLVLHLTMAALLAAVVVREQGAGAAILRQRWLVRVGVVSYGIYLYHLLVLEVVLRLLTPFGLASDGIVLVIYCLLSWAVAEVSFRTLEAFFQRFRPKA